MRIINQASQVSSALAQKPKVLLKEILLDDTQVEVFLLTPLQLNLRVKIDFSIDFYFPLEQLQIHLIQGAEVDLSL